jgi:hypothetical protein
MMHPNSSTLKPRLPVEEKQKLETLARSVRINNPAALIHDLQAVINQAELMIITLCPEFAALQPDARPPDPTPYDLWRRLL